MQETADTTHADSGTSPPAPSPPPPPAPAPGRPGVFRRLLAPTSFPRRRPWLSLSLALLFALLASAGGGFLWFEYHLRAARREMALGHNRPAIHHLRACRELRPNEPEVLLLSARVARRSNAWAEANRLLDEYWESYGDDEALVTERLLQRATEGEVEEVLPLLQARIDHQELSPSLAREALVAGLMYRFRLDDAEKRINAWLEDEPESTFALLALGKLQEVREQASNACQTYRRLLAIDPEHDEARLHLTALLLGLNQGKEALAHLEYLRPRLPDNPTVAVRLAQALALQGRGTDARAVVAECLARHPDHPAALAEQGRFSLEDGDTERAEECLARAIQLDPSESAPHYHYLLALNRNGKKAEVAKQQEAIHRMEEDTQRIRELLDVQLQRTPNDPEVYYEVGLIALRAGRPKEALRWLRNALQVDPAHVPTHRALASYYYRTGNPILSAKHRALAQKLEKSATP
jgi:tetratricopeptide (TPR) repeat protein